MTRGTLLTIGELARLTGLPVKTVRFWSDQGLVLPVSRTPAGPGFRASLRQTAIGQARALAEAPAEPTPEEHRAMASLLRERVAAATAAGIEPDSPQARPVADELVAAYARHSGHANGPAFRSSLLDQLESASDRRYERYWQLLAIINGWPPTPSITPAAEWLIKALRSS